MWLQVLGRCFEMKTLVSLFLVVVSTVGLSPTEAKIVCEPGYAYGHYQPCLKAYRVSGHQEGRRPVDARRVGKVEKVEKNLDGSVTVWHHGSPDAEEWRQTNETTWERTR